MYLKSLARRTWLVAGAAGTCLLLAASAAYGGGGSSPSGAAGSTAPLSASGVVMSSMPASSSARRVEVAPDSSSPTVKVQSASLGGYEPQTITVKVGTTVTFKNVDTIKHTVTSDAAGAFNSHLMDPGATWKNTFKTAGTFPYHCSIHPQLKGTVVVQS